MSVKIMIDSASDINKREAEELGPGAVGIAFFSK